MSKKSRAKNDLNSLRPSPCTDKKWKSPMLLTLPDLSLLPKIMVTEGGGGGLRDPRYLMNPFCSKDFKLCGMLELVKQMMFGNHSNQSTSAFLPIN